MSLIAFPYLSQQKMSEWKAILSRTQWTNPLLDRKYRLN